MSVEHKSGLVAAVRILREQQAADQNFAAEKHLDWANFRVPVDKGNLRKSNRQTEVATAENPRAVVVSGGITTEDGTVVDYAAAVNNGSHHVLENGIEYTIPPNPYWDEAAEVGRETLERQQDIRSRREKALKNLPVNRRTA